MAGEITLSSEDYQNLLESQRRLAVLDREYDKFEECGGDCSQLRAIRQQMGSDIDGLIKHYAPKGANRFPGQQQ